MKPAAQFGRPQVEYTEGMSPIYHHVCTLRPLHERCQSSPNMWVFLIRVHTHATSRTPPPPPSRLEMEQLSHNNNRFDHFIYQIELISIVSTLKIKWFHLESHWRYYYQLVVFNWEQYFISSTEGSLLIEHRNTWRIMTMGLCSIRWICTRSAHGRWTFISESTKNKNWQKRINLLIVRRSWCYKRYFKSDKWTALSGRKSTLSPRLSAIGFSSRLSEYNSLIDCNEIIRDRRNRRANASALVVTLMPSIIEHRTSIAHRERYCEAMTVATNAPDNQDKFKFSVFSNLPMVTRPLSPAFCGDVEFSDRRCQ